MKLPKYAKKADKSRLVRLLCKNSCNRVRYAEMTNTWPGSDVLRRSHLGDYEAKCLMCGKIAKDGYNWISA